MESDNPTLIMWQMSSNKLENSLRGTAIGYKDGQRATKSELRRATDDI